MTFNKVCFYQGRVILQNLFRMSAILEKCRYLARDTSFCNMQMSNRFVAYRVYVRTFDGRQGWLPSSILMQTALSEETSSMSRPEDSHYRRE